MDPPSKRDLYPGSASDFRDDHPKSREDTEIPRENAAFFRQQIRLIYARYKLSLGHKNKKSAVGKSRLRHRTVETWKGQESNVNG